MKHLTTLTLLLIASTAQAACLPPLNTQTLTPKWVVSDNARAVGRAGSVQTEGFPHPAHAYVPLVGSFRPR